MGKTTTEQKAKSQDKSIIQNIGYPEFSAVCQEYQQVQKSTKELLEIANNPKTPARVRVDIHKWIVEMNIGKPKQMTDVNINPEPEQSVYNVFTNLGSDSIVKAISKKYSIPYEELKEYEYQIGIRVNRLEYQNPNKEVDIDKVMSDIEQGVLPY